MPNGTISVFAGAIVLGLIHGAEPGHGWPIAAAYALDRSRRLLAGVTAAVVLGVGHLISSIAVVAAFLLLASSFDAGSLAWLRYVAGVILIGLGVRELRGGHTHPDDASHEHADGHDITDRHGDEHAHADLRQAADERGLFGIASAAFLLGFAHEEEFQILGFCTGATNQCVSLMLVYAVAVILSLVVLTSLLVAGFERYEDRVGRFARYFPTISGVVLVLLGAGFLLGVV